MRRILIFTLRILCVSPAVIAQTSSQGATQLYFALLKRFASPPQLDKDAAERLQAKHMENIHRSYDEGRLVVAGPFMEYT